MVATPHYLASAAGLSALAQGGNATDATVTAAAVLSVVYPHMCSIGGDAFALVFDTREGSAVGLNGSGRAPNSLSRDLLAARGVTSMPGRGPLAVTVPGVVDAWERLLDRFGTWELGRALGPAIGYARDGFPVTAKLAGAFLRHESIIRGSRTASRTYLEGGRLPRAFDSLRLPQLARTLDQIATNGASIFYRGELCERLCSGLAAEGGVIATEDLMAHSSTWVRPLEATYRGVRVLELPPNTQGAIALLMLKLAEQHDLTALGHNTAASIRVLVEAKRIAFRVGRSRITDPDHMASPVDELLAPGSIAELRRSPSSSALGGLSAIGGDTTFLCAVDRSGGVCGLIQSVYSPFGSGVIAGDTGILLQNRAASFSLDPAHINRLEPGKRTFHTLIPAVAMRHGKPWLVFGTSGADGQAQTQVQILSSIVDHGLHIQAAIDAPRWVHGRVLPTDEVEVIVAEEPIGEDVARALRDDGHVVRTVPFPDAGLGHAQAILIDQERGLLEGAADPRADGMAMGH